MASSVPVQNDEDSDIQVAGDHYLTLWLQDMDADQRLQKELTSLVLEVSLVSQGVTTRSGAIG